ncbi:MAG: GAP family protein [Micropruina sp.]|uniref:GAP family protein n=1 Tax=Micropruina sp. TaxID=2737536 RepID=UPI0039E5716E
MWTSIGDTLPLAMGLALSPFAIVTGIVLLLGSKGRLKTAMFGLGWFAAILTIVAIAFWVVGAAEEVSEEYASGGVDVVQLAFAALFLVLAGLSWVKRPKGQDGASEGAEPAKSKLLDRLDGLSVLGALGVGLAQGFIVIKNIPLALGAGARLGEAGLHGGEAVIAMVLFALISALGVLVPLIVALIGGPSLDDRLRSLRTWLEANMSAITIVVLLVLGGYFLGQGLGILD